jgi:peroxiredoxin
VIAASVDPEDKAREFAKDLGFPVAFGVTRAAADAIGATWNAARNCIEPTEFLLDQAGAVVGSLYAAGPVGRMNPQEVIRLVQARERMMAGR